jgi:hypothetical protein
MTLTPSERQRISEAFDEKFKCIQGGCDGTGHIPEQVSEDEWTSSQCQFHAEYLIPMKEHFFSTIENILESRVKEIENIELAPNTKTTEALEELESSFAGFGYGQIWMLKKVVSLLKGETLKETNSERIEPDTNDPSQFPADGNDLVQ